MRVGLVVARCLLILTACLAARIGLFHYPGRHHAVLWLDGIALCGLTAFGLLRHRGSSVWPAVTFFTGALLVVTGVALAGQQYGRLVVPSLVIYLVLSVAIAPDAAHNETRRGQCHPPAAEAGASLPPPQSDGATEPHREESLKVACAACFGAALALGAISHPPLGLAVDACGVVLAVCQILYVWCSVRPVSFFFSVVALSVAYIGVIVGLGVASPWLVACFALGTLAFALTHQRSREGSRLRGS